MEELSTQTTHTQAGITPTDIDVGSTKTESKASSYDNLLQECYQYYLCSSRAFKQTYDLEPPGSDLSLSVSNSPFALWPDNMQS